MSGKQKLLFGLAIVVILVMSLNIVFNENGIMDMIRLHRDHQRLIQKNEAIRQENMALYREIDRLQNDPEYLEEVVRKESKMVRPGEIVVRMKRSGEEGR